MKKVMCEKSYKRKNVELKLGKREKRIVSPSATPSKGETMRGKRLEKKVID